MAIEMDDKEREARNLKPIWRLCGWAGGAAAALAAVMVTLYTDTGSKRLQFALASAAERGQTTVVASMPSPTVDNSLEIKQLAETVRTFAADRDRLKIQVANLQQTLADVTGSIKSEAAADATVQSAKDKNVAKDRIVATPPVLSAPATAAPQIQMATPVPEQVPLPPARIASVSANEPPPAKPEFGIDLGGGATVEAVRSQWSAIKANFGPLLLGLHPVATARARKPGVPEYRLVVGPLESANAAAKLCARFIAHPNCRPAKFDGQRIALQ
jgi:hypothetical protein